jgi:hypothetical protein
MLKTTTLCVKIIYPREIEGKTKIGILSLDEHKINSSMYNSIAVLKTIKAILYEK